MNRTKSGFVGDAARERLGLALKQLLADHAAVA
jgi:hypothetical protein